MMADPQADPEPSSVSGPPAVVAPESYTPGLYELIGANQSDGPGLDREELGPSWGGDIA
jgi:hypothetical protein